MRLFNVFLFVCLAHFAAAQSDITTVILVRHAEKANDGTKDPELSAEGQARATRLAQVLVNEKVSAIYSTNYKRTKNTVKPLAAASGIEVTVYESMTRERFQEVITSNRGGTIVICGHSNTTPVMVNTLTGEETLKQFEDSDYGNLIIVSVPASGPVKVTRLTY